jgi:hypothetical protein
MLFPFLYSQNIRLFFDKNKDFFSFIINNYFIFVLFISLLLLLLFYVQNYLKSIKETFKKKLELILVKYIKNKNLLQSLSETIFSIPYKLILPFIALPAMLYFPQDLIVESMGNYVSTDKVKMGSTLAGGLVVGGALTYFIYLKNYPNVSKQPTAAGAQAQALEDDVNL